MEDIVQAESMRGIDYGINSTVYYAQVYTLELDNMNEREQRGLEIAALTKLTKKGGVWLVPSQSGKGRYTVVPHASEPHCDCPDHETRGCKCKHIYAVEFALRREENEDGS